MRKIKRKISKFIYSKTATVIVAIIIAGSFISHELPVINVYSETTSAPTSENIIEAPSEYDAAKEILSLLGVETEIYSSEKTRAIATEYGIPENETTGDPLTKEALTQILTGISNPSEEDIINIINIVNSISEENTISGHALNKILNCFFEYAYSDDFKGAILHPVIDYEKIEIPKAINTREDLEAILYHIIANRKDGQIFIPTSVSETKLKELKDILNAIKKEHIEKIAPEFASIIETATIDIFNSNSGTVVDTNILYKTTQAAQNDFLTDTKEILIDLHKKGQIKQNMSDEEKAFILYKWITKNVEYEPPTLDITKDSKYMMGITALYEGKASCLGFTALYNALCKYEGLNVDAYTCHLQEETENIDHIMTRLYTEDEIIYIDTSGGAYHNSDSYFDCTVI